ncbi:MAG: RepB family DNA primase [Rickettsiales bacterium]|jgi:hypothetical protein|nr:RepB family DNA primase [Rickettsiales bacterium]
MSDYTLNAIIRQLTAMNCVKYKIGIFNRKEHKMINRDQLYYDGILKIIPWLKFQNAEGKDIYITQANDIDRALILVDDLSRSKIKEMSLRGMTPACVLETSPSNFQVWVSLGPDPMPKEERKVAAKLLAEQFGGDIASTDANHYGRLAGFTNRKESRLTRSGYPFVKCWEAEGGDAEKSQALREWAKAKCLRSGADIADIVKPQTTPRKGEGRIQRRDPAEVFDQYFDEWSRYVVATGKSMDFSRGDFAVACRMLKEGYSEDQIMSALIHSSPDILKRKNKHIEDYAIRTIKAAARVV